ncbi:MAG: TIR domain-containing protein [Nitrospiria bacterium]
MAQIFVSYSRSNQQMIQKLVEDIEITGNDIWFDQTLTGGQPWWDNILKNIRSCDIFVLALSPESLDSDACKDEWNYAAQLGKTILPIRLSDRVNVNLLPRHLSKIQVTDYLAQDRDALRALSQTIKGLPPSASLPTPLPAPPPVPVSYLGTLKEQIETTETLNLETQVSLVFKLKAGLSEGRSSSEVRELLCRLKQRDDLLAKVGTEIDAVLEGMGKTPGAKQPHRADRPGDRTRESAPHASEAPQDTDVAGGMHCAQCGDRNPINAKFCSACGQALSVQTTPSLKPATVEDHPDRKGVKSRRFICAPDDYGRLISDLKGWLEGQDYACQQIATEEGGVLLQVAQTGSWRKFVGMATSLNVHMHQDASTITVEIGAGKWVDKAAAGTVSLFVLWPLAVTAGIGAWQQIKLPDKIFDYLGSKLVSR